jgi:hypothetical protein
MLMALGTCCIGGRTLLLLISGLRLTRLINGRSQDERMGDADKCSGGVEVSLGCTVRVHQYSVESRGTGIGTVRLFRGQNAGTVSLFGAHRDLQKVMRNACAQTDPGKESWIGRLVSFTVC